jgi:glycosyltransferase involved in cell wall biosynthesis
MMTDNDQRVTVIEVLEATTGGTRRHLFDLVTNLDSSKFSVSVVCSTLRDPAFLEDVKKIRALGIAVTDIPMHRAISPMRDIVALWRIWRHFRANRPDVVHTHSSKAGFLGRIAAKLAGTKLIIHSPHVFAFEMGGSNMLKAFFFRLEQFAARLTDHMICVCSGERETAIGHKLATSESCSVVPNGIDVPDIAKCKEMRTQKRHELGLSDEDIIIGSVGRFTKQKGLTYFLDAARQLAEKLPRARFILVGNGELQGEIETLIKQYRIANRCVALTTDSDFASYYPIFDIFLLTSLWEGMPYAMLEAMATGRAVVAFKTGGIPDVITDAITGILQILRITLRIYIAVSRPCIARIILQVVYVIIETLLEGCITSETCLLLGRYTVF